VSIIMGVSISWMPVSTWSQLFIMVISGVIVYLLLLFIFRVLKLEELMAIKEKLI